MSGEAALLAGLPHLVQRAATIPPPVGLAGRVTVAEMPGALAYVAAGQAQPAAGQQIGSMPNLDKIIGEYMATL